MTKKRTVKKPIVKKTVVTKEKEVETPAPPETAAQIEQIRKSDEQTTKEHLDRQPKVNFIVPLSPGEPVGSIETVIINGYRLNIRKGTMVTIPDQVANMLAEKYKIEMDDGSDKRLDRNPESQNALS